MAIDIVTSTVEFSQPSSTNPPPSASGGDAKFKIATVLLLLVAVGLTIWLVLTINQKNDAERAAAASQRSATSSQTVSSAVIERARRAAQRTQAERETSAKQAKKAVATADSYLAAKKKADAAAQQKAADRLQQLGYAVALLSYESGRRKGVDATRLALLKAAVESNDTPKVVELLTKYDVAEVLAVLKALERLNSSAAYKSGAKELTQPAHLGATQ